VVCCSVTVAEAAVFETVSETVVFSVFSVVVTALSVTVVVSAAELTAELSFGAELSVPQAARQMLIRAMAETRICFFMIVSPLNE
jgi:hypothetical protein